MPRKVGGNLEVFIHTKARSMKSVESVVSSVEELGGRVLHAYPPRVIVALVPTDQVDALEGKRYVSAVYTDPIKPSQIKAAASTSRPGGIESVTGPPVAFVSATSRPRAAHSGWPRSVRSRALPEG